MKSFAHKYVLLPLVIMLIATSVTGCNWFKKRQPVEAETPTTVQATPTPEETQLPPEERPIVDMQVDAKVQKMKFEITNVPEDVHTIEYTVTYMTNGLERGGLGMYEVGSGQKEFAFGSASSGVYKFDENVTDILMSITYRTNGQKVFLRYPYNPRASE